MRNVPSAQTHKRVNAMELERFAFGQEAKTEPQARPAVNLYFCAADGNPMVKPSASSSGLGTWQKCSRCGGRKVRREKL